jgi:hypothetical protein
LDGTDALSHSSNINLSSACSIFTTLTAVSAVRVWYGSGSTNYLATFPNAVYSVASNAQRIATDTFSGQTLYNFTRDGSTGGTWYKNSSALTTTGSQTSQTLVLNNVGGFNPYKHVGPIQEIIVYPSDKSANRTNIEANMNTFYSIY